MKKKIILFIGIAIFLGSLFINVVVYEHSEKTDLAFTNIEALAGQETSAGSAQCVESGYVCIGTDKNGNLSNHIGLRQASK